MPCLHSLRSWAKHFTFARLRLAGKMIIRPRLCIFIGALLNCLSLNNPLINTIILFQLFLFYFINFLMKWNISSAFILKFYFVQAIDSKYFKSCWNLKFSVFHNYVDWLIIHFMTITDNSSKKVFVFLFRPNFHFRTLCNV